MRLYSSAYLTFGCTVPRDLEEWFDSGPVGKFNRENGADLGHLKVGSFEDNELYLVTFCESASPHEPKKVRVKTGTRKQRAIWRRQLEKFLRQHKIDEHGEIDMRLLADLDN